MRSYNRKTAADVKREANERRIYKISLALPIILPVASYLALTFLIKPLDSGNPDSFYKTLKMIPAIFIYSIWFAGIPYLVLALSLLIWMRGKDRLEMRRALLFSPLIFIPIFSAFWLIIFAATELAGDPVFLLFIVCTVFIVPLGYFYVLIAFGIARLFRRKPFNRSDA